MALWGPNPGVAPGSGMEQWEQQTTTLYLVDSMGGRYKITTFPAPATYSLADWSGDGRRVLVVQGPSTASTTSQVEEIDLSTGAVLHQLSAPSVGTVRYTRPQGLAVLEEDDTTSTSTLTRFALSGSSQLTYPASFPGLGTLSNGFLPSLDGTQLVVATAQGMALVANDGTFIRALGPAGTSCSPERWWDATDLVATCQPSAATGSTVPTVWLVPTSGGAGTQLVVPGQGDNGDIDAWQIESNLYVQAAGGCGSEYLAQRKANGTTGPVTVPNTQNSGTISVIGAVEDQLALQAVVGCGTGQTLFWYNPTLNAKTFLLGGALNGGGVESALAYPGIEP